MNSKKGMAGAGIGPVSLPVQLHQEDRAGVGDEGKLDTRKAQEALDLVGNHQLDLGRPVNALCTGRRDDRIDPRLF